LLATKKKKKEGKTQVALIWHKT